MTATIFLVCLFFHFTTAEWNGKHSVQIRQAPSNELDSGCANESSIIDVLLHNYNKNQPPRESVTVTVEFYIQDVSAVSDASNDFEIDLFVSRQWLDPRLAFNSMMPCKSNITVNEDVMVKFWTPKSGFTSGAVTSHHQSSPNNDVTMILANGSVWWSSGARVKVMCDSDLTTFPADTKMCKFVYGNIDFAHVRMQSAKTPVVLVKYLGLTLPEFRLVNYSVATTTYIYPAGTSDEITATFSFARNKGWYILHFYIPTAAIVLANWLSLAIGIKGKATRMLIGVVSIFFVIILLNDTTKHLPRVPYITALDLWALVCIGFLLLSLLVLAIISYLTRESFGYQGESVTSTRYEPFLPEEHMRRGGKRSSSYSRRARIAARVADILDIVFIALAPVLFATFVTLYWTLYI